MAFEFYIIITFYSKIDHNYHMLAVFYIFDLVTYLTCYNQFLNSFEYVTISITPWKGRKIEFNYEKTTKLNIII